MINPGGIAYALVEGHGEVQAVGNLLTRLSADLGISFPWSNPIRWKNLHSEEGLKKGAEFIRSRTNVRSLLILRDEDDDCPKERGPEMANWLQQLNLPFPSSVVLLHPEYEVLFLPCLDLMAGKPIKDPSGRDRPGLKAGTSWDRTSWEARRGVKEWLSRGFPPNRSYRPTLDQLPMTRMLDFDRLRDADVPCFGTLERALRFLGQSLDPGEVYPPGLTPPTRSS